MSPPSGTFLINRIKLCWVWGSRVGRTWTKSLGYLCLAVTFLVALVAVSALSSYIVDGKDLQALAHSNEFLPFNMNTVIHSKEGFVVLSSYHTKMNLRSKPLAQNYWCGSTSRPFSSRTFIQASVSPPIDSSVPLNFWPCR